MRVLFCAVRAIEAASAVLQYLLSTDVSLQPIGIPGVRIRRVDNNQKEVVKAIRKIGGEVTHMHTLGKGVCDLLVSFRNRWLVMEVKDGSKPPSARELTTDEKEWVAKQKAPVHIVNSPMEAIEILQMVNP